MDDIWAELGASMRRLRENAGRSLRQLEAATGRGRGVLSQIETGRARPNRDVVEWYDHAFGADGLLVSMYAEARGAHGASRTTRLPVDHQLRGDELSVGGAEPSYGSRVRPGETVRVTWQLRNAGTVAWRGRGLRRVGAVAAERLLGSPPCVPLPDTTPGSAAQVTVPVTVPTRAGTFAAYWEVVDNAGGRCFGRDNLLSAVLVADW